MPDGTCPCPPSIGPLTTCAAFRMRFWPGSTAHTRTSGTAICTSHHVSRGHARRGLHLCAPDAGISRARLCRRRAAAGRSRAMARGCGRARGTIPARLIPERSLRLRQREVGASRHRSPISHRSRPRDQRRIRRLCRRWRLSTAQALGRGRLAVARQRRRRAPDLLESRRRQPLDRAPLRPDCGVASAPPCRPRQLARGQCVVPLGWPAPAERDRMGGRSRGRADARRLARRRQAYLSLGRLRRAGHRPMSMVMRWDASMSPPVRRATAPGDAGR